MITIKDVVTGTKVKLNGKHYPYEKTYDNIDDWFKDNEWSPSCMEIKENGFAYIANEFAGVGNHHGTESTGKNDSDEQQLSG